MKPSERNALRSKIKNATTEIAKLERALKGFTPGTLPHNRLSTDLSRAKAELTSATSLLAPSTQPRAS